MSLTGNGNPRSRASARLPPRCAGRVTGKVRSTVKAYRWPSTLSSSFPRAAVCTGRVRLSMQRGCVSVGLAGWLAGWPAGRVFTATKTSAHHGNASDKKLGGGLGDGIATSSPSSRYIGKPATHRDPGEGIWRPKGWDTRQGLFRTPPRSGTLRVLFVNKGAEEWVYSLSLSLDREGVVVR